MTQSNGPEHSWRDLLADGRLPRFALVCLGAWLHAADALVTATILPSVGAELGGYAYFGWAVAGYFTGCILAGATAGRLAERLGLPVATAAAGVFYAAGCLLSAMAPDVGLFLTGRVAQGVGAGWISGFCYVVMGLVFPERHLPRLLAGVSAVWGVATFAGPLVGGLFANHHAWRGVFWMFAAQACLFSVAAMILLPHSAEERGRHGVPIPQMAVLTAAVTALGFAGLNRTLLGAGALVLLSACLLLLALRIDRTARVQLLPRATSNLNSPVGVGYAAIFLLTAAAAGLSTYGPAILQALRGLSPLLAGYVVAAESFGWFIAAIVSTRAQPPWDGRLIRLGGLSILAGAVGLALSMRGAPLAAVIASGALQGAGFGMSWGFLSARILKPLPSEEMAIGSSALGAVFQAGTAVGAAVAAVAANLSGLSTGLSPAAAQTAAVWVYVWALPLAVAGAAAAWRLGRN